MIGYTIGNGEVGSSILPCGTSSLCKIRHLAKRRLENIRSLWREQAWTNRERALPIRAKSVQSIWRL